MPIKAKVVALIMMWSSIITSGIFFIKNNYALASVVGCRIIGTIMILMIKTLKITNDSDFVVKEELGVPGNRNDTGERPTELDGGSKQGRNNRSNL